MMETSKPEIKSIRISADQKSILKKTFEKFPSPNHSAEALDLLSLKTGLRSELIKKWFQKRRLALDRKNYDDEIQILDDNSTNNEELEKYDEDYIDLDNDDSLESSSVTGAVSSTSSGVELSMESKAAEYNLLKQQMELLQSQLSQMTQNLELPPDNPPPPPVSDYYYPSQGYTNYHPQQQQQYPYQYQYQQQPRQPLPYPPYSNYFYPGYSQRQLYNQTYWTLPYPPPDFQLVIPDPPAVAREDHSEAAPVVEKQELEESVQSGGGQVTKAEAEENLVEEKEPTEKEENYFNQKEIPIETKTNEETFETAETPETLATSETPETPESKTNIADQTAESKTEKDLENASVTPTETDEKVDNVSTISQRDSVAEPVNRVEITDSTTEEILERYKNIGDFPQNIVASPQNKYPPTPFKKNESLENLEEEDTETDLNEDDLKTFEEDTSVLTEKNNLDLSLLITGPEDAGEETLDENLPPRNISDPDSEGRSNLSNVSFLQALEEIPKKSETPDVVPIDDEKPAPKPFIVKEEPKEVKQMKLGRKSLPTKAKPRVFVPVATLDEMDSEENLEKQNLSELPVLPPARTKRFYKGQSINKTTNPSFVEPQKTLQQNSKQRPKAKPMEPSKQLRITQQKPPQSPAPPRSNQSQPPRGNKRTQPDQSQSQSRAKTARQKPPAAPRIAKINNYSTITVTKVVEPPTIPPSKRPELQRILKMSNLSVSIKR